MTLQRRNSKNVSTEKSESDESESRSEIDEEDCLESAQFLFAEKYVTTTEIILEWRHRILMTSQFFTHWSLMLLREISYIKRLKFVEEMANVVIKPVDLPKNFGISRKSKVESWTLSDGWNKSGILTLVSNVQKFCKTKTETTEIIKNFVICQKFRYIFDIFDIRRYMSKIYRNFRKSTVSVKCMCFETVRHIRNIYASSLIYTSRP